MFKPTFKKSVVKPAQINGLDNERAIVVSRKLRDAAAYTNSVEDMRGMYDLADECNHTNYLSIVNTALHTYGITITMER